MDASTKEIIQVVTWVVAILGGLVAAFKAIHEIAQNRKLRAQELRWKKAQLGREILNNLKANVRFRDALLMLDWSGREYQITDEKREAVEWADLPAALRSWKEPISFSDKEVYIRDCFDDLLEGINVLEHYLRTGLLEFADVHFPMAYYVGKIREHWTALTVYLHHYDNGLALAFIARFETKGIQTTTGSA